MKERQKRVEEEKSDLCAKLAKLRAFRITPDYAALDYQNRALLDQQEQAMQQYADVLGQRIALLA